MKICIRQILLVPLLFPLSLFAGTYHDSSIIGFSRDGRYVAYQAMGTEDGSGFSFCTIRFVDVVKNRFVGRKISVVDREMESGSGGGATKMAMRQAAPYLKRYRIVQGNRGVAKYINKSSGGPLSMNSTSQVAFEARDRGGVKKKYRVVLKTSSSGGETCNSMGGEFESVPGFELILVRDKTKITLERVSRLPASLGCAMGFGIHSVTTYRGNVVVFLDGAFPGFEGPDTKKLVVTGVLN